MKLRLSLLPGGFGIVRLSPRVALPAWLAWEGFASVTRTDEELSIVCPEGLVPAETQAERGFRHTAVMHSKDLDHLSRMAREMDCSIFVKNAPSFAGLGYGGEGFCSFTIASPTGEGVTSPISFSRLRRCVLKDSFRIV